MAPITFAHVTKRFDETTAVERAKDGVLTESP